MADTTVTFTLPKPGLLLADGPRCAGTVWAVNIGLPEGALVSVGVELPEGFFAASDRVRIA